MQYDALFKSIFQSDLNSLILLLVGSPAVEQLNASAKELADLLLGLMIVSGLRKLSGAVREEADNMAFDIEELVREFERELIQEGEAAVLRRQLERRFGPLSPEALERIEQATVAEIEEWSLRVLDARTLEDVFA